MHNTILSNLEVLTAFAFVYAMVVVIVTWSDARKRRDL